MKNLTRDLAELVITPYGEIDRAAREVVAFRCGRIIAGVGDATSDPWAGEFPAFLLGLAGSPPPGDTGARPDLGIREQAAVAAAAAASALRSAEVVPVPHDPLVEVPTLAAAVAVATRLGVEGSCLLDAVVVGVEAGLRLEGALATALTRKGWQVGAVSGRIGSTAAAARLLGLSLDQVVVALSITATQVGGFASAEDTPAWLVATAAQAADAVEAACLASAGFTGPGDPIGGRRGLIAVAAGGPEPLADLTAGQADGHWVSAVLPGSEDLRWARLGSAGDGVDFDRLEDAASLSLLQSRALR